MYKSKHNAIFPPKIFEAVAQKEDREGVASRLQSSERDEDRRRRIEETRHVVKELKSVLHVKTSAEQREIRKSKLFPDYVPKIVPKSDVDSVGADSFQAEENVDTAPCALEAGSELLGQGEMHELLTFPRKAAIPNRPRKRRKSGLERAVNARDGCESDDCGSGGEESCKFPLGFGMPSDLARQAAMAARSAKVELPGWRMAEECTFEDSSS